MRISASCSSLSQLSSAFQCILRETTTLEPPTSTSIQSYLAFYIPGGPYINATSILVWPVIKTFYRWSCHQPNFREQNQQDFKLRRRWTCVVRVCSECRRSLHCLSSSSAPFQAFQRIRVVFRHLANARSPHPTRTDGLRLTRPTRRGVMDSKRQRCDKALLAIVDLESSTCFITDLLLSKAHTLEDHQDQGRVAVNPT